MTSRTLALLLIAAQLALVSCKGNAGEDGSVLSARVDGYCTDFAHYLEMAADSYEELAPALDSGQLTPQQHDRVALLVSDGIGVTADVRITRMQDIYKTLLFCISVRQIDERHEGALEERLGHLKQSLSEHDMDRSGVGRTMSHVDAAKDLHDLAALAREVSRLPKRP